jgi:hypothetical protein
MPSCSNMNGQAYAVLHIQATRRLPIKLLRVLGRGEMGRQCLPLPACLLSIQPFICRTCGEHTCKYLPGRRTFSAPHSPLQTLVRQPVETPTYPAGLPSGFAGKTTIAFCKHPPCFDVFDLCPHSATIDERPWNSLDEARVPCSCVKLPHTGSSYQGVYGQ